MKTNTFLFCLLLSVGSLIAQNAAPVLSITNVVVDDVNQKVTVSYTLTDADNDNCEVWLKLSQDGGEFFQTQATGISGDAGTNITAGGGKSLVWDYSGFGGNIYGVQLKLVASDHKPVDISQMVAQVDSLRLKNRLQYIEGIRHFTAGLAHLNEVRDSIETNFNRFGLQTSKQAYAYSGQTSYNILGRKPGMKDEGVTFIIDGHYDCVANSPGADDNGSAVTGMLECLEILSQYEFEHSLRFIGFDNEEQGLIGSQRYVQNGGIKTYEDIQGVLNYEMIGYYKSTPNSQQVPAGFDILFPAATQAISSDSSKGNFLIVCGNTASNPLTTKFMTTAAQYVPALRCISLEVPGTGTVAPDLRRSDHARFWDAGKQALMLNDGANYRNPFYHTANDTIGTLNFTFMANVVKATLATAADLAVPISAGYATFDLSTLASLDHVHDFPAQLRLYPNPAKDFVQVEVQASHAFHAKIEVYQPDGTLVHSTKQVCQPGENLLKIKVQNLAKGNYLLLLTDGDHSLTQTFVVE